MAVGPILACAACVVQTPDFPIRLQRHNQCHVFFGGVGVCVFVVVGVYMLHSPSGPGGSGEVMAKQS